MENRLQNYSHDLGERVKELNCLHEISKLIEGKDLSFDMLLQEIVALIPPAWQYPEDTCSRIVIDEIEYKTENFQKTKWLQMSDIFVFKERIGVLEVYYLDEKPEMDASGYVGALRAKELVKQILTFSRQENEDLKLLKIQPIIREALKLIRSSIPATIEIKQNIRPDCGTVKVDPTQIHQIIMNLATNAYHAMGDTGGKLIIGLKKIEFSEFDRISTEMTPGVYLCLAISDTGTGMNKDLIQKIFDPFFTTKEKVRVLNSMFICR